MSIKYFAMRGETNIGYIIAPPNASEEDKKKADLVLDDVNGSPHTQLADMVDMLHDRRGQNTDIAIVIEFCPGDVELPSGANWEIPETKGNFYIYGNGVTINGNIEYDYLFSVVDCWLFDLEVENNSSYGSGISATNSTLSNCKGSAGDGYGIYANNSTLSNCTGNTSNSGRGIYANNSTLTNCSGISSYGHGVYADNSTLTNCSGSGVYGSGISVTFSTLTNCSGSSGGEYGSGINASNSTLSNCDGVSTGDGIFATNSTLTNCSGSGSDFGDGIYAYKSTLSNCSGSSDEYHGIYATGSCIIQGCDGENGGISVPEGFVGTYPNTLALLQAFNKGSIIEREDEE